MNNNLRIYYIPPPPPAVKINQEATQAEGKPKYKGFRIGTKGRQPWHTGRKHGTKNKVKPKGKMITFKASEVQIARWKKKAAQAEMSYSGWIRRSLDRASNVWNKLETK